MAKYDEQASERRLETMLEDYGRIPVPPGFNGRLNPETCLRNAIEASPELKRNLLTAIGEGYIESLTRDNPGRGAGAAYTPADKAISIPYPDVGHPMDLVFTLGHEVQHALDARGERYVAGTLTPAIEAISRSDAKPHDYTQPLSDFIEHTRTSEARAEIGGFNAVVSAMRHAGMSCSNADIARMMPGSSQEFLVPAAADSGEYKLRGLVRNEDGTLPFSSENIDAMKVNYADRLPGTFGDNGLLDYRHEAILHGLEIVHLQEKHRILEALRPQDAPTPREPSESQHLRSAGSTVALESIPVFDVPPNGPKTGAATAYHVDFDALGANPALLRFPADGMLSVSDPTVGAHRIGFQEDHPGFVVGRAEARRNLGLPPDPDRPWRNDPQRPHLSPGVPDLPEIHPLHRLAAEGLNRLEPLAALSTPDQRTDAAAAVALTAAEHGMARVDHVLLSRDGKGLIVVQGDDPTAPQARLARVELADLPPADRSLDRLEALTAQTRTAGTQDQTPTQEPAPAPRMV